MGVIMNCEMCEKKDKEMKEERLKYLVEISRAHHEVIERMEALEFKNRELEAKVKFVKEPEVVENNEELPRLESTNVERIDDILRYMQHECYKEDIEFTLKMNGYVNYMVDNIIMREDLETMIGDFIRNSIRAINADKSGMYKADRHVNMKSKFILGALEGNRQIKVILGRNEDKLYEFCVYDSGTEFEIDTLIKLGLEQVTTHSGNGGSGIGFMSTFETIKKCNASIIIIENDSHEGVGGFTKFIKVLFDNQNKYIIRSYRADYIRKHSTDNRIIIEKI